VISHDQYDTWNMNEILNDDEIKQWLILSKSIPFDVQIFPQYIVTNVTGAEFSFCKAQMHILQKFI